MPDYYPPVGFHFSVDFSPISGKDNDTRFQSVSGLEVRFNTEPWKEGGENRFEHSLPVRTQYANLILKRGLLKGSKLIKWCKDSFEDLKIKPVDLRVALLDENQQPLLSWNVVRAWPIKWAVSDFNSEQNSLVIETLELKYDYFDLIG